MLERFKLDLLQIHELHGYLEGQLNTDANSVINSLLIGIDSTTTAKLPTGDIPSLRLRQIINAVNEMDRLTTGEFPLEYLLLNAVELLGKEPGAIQVRQLSDKAGRDVLVTKLIKIIEPAQIDEPQLAQLYDQCLPERLRTQYSFSLIESYHSLDTLFEINHSQYGFGFCICLFANILSHISSGAKTDEWVHEAIRRFKWRFEKDDVYREARTILEKVNEKPYVSSYQQITARVTCIDANNYDHILVDFFEPNEKGEFENANWDPLETNIRLLPEKIRERLDANLTSRAFIELMLPSELMHVNIEFAERKQDCLVGPNIVVRRFGERQVKAQMNANRPAAAKKIRYINFWKDRWHQSFGQGNRPVHQFHRRITHACLVDLDNLFYDLKSTEEICCTICEENPKEPFMALLRQHLEWGIPAMIWPGHDGSNRLGQDDIDRLLSTPATRLPHQVRELQKERLLASKARFSENNLFIIFDDPNRMLPTRLQEDKTHG
ncbi:MAG: hypothetical protein AAF702_16550 [Chloroflexota bacterium]